MNKLIRQIFQNKNISYLFCGQLVSQMGDSMFLIGLMWLVLDITGSKSSMGIVAFVAHIPNLVLGLFSGIIVDTFNRRKVMMISDIARAIVVLAIPITYFLDLINLTIIIATAFVLSTFATLFNPARDSILPELVERKDLLKANSLIQSSNYTAILLGPALGAMFIELFGIANLFTIDSVTFLISFATILMISYKRKSEVKKQKISIGFHLKEILSYVKDQKKLKFLLILTAVNNFFIMGPAIVGIPIFVKDVLNEGASSYALVESCYGIGMIAGSIIVNYVNKFIGKGKILILGLLFDGITYAVLYFVGDLHILMISIVIHAVGIPFIVVARTSLMQEWTDSKKLGRVFSLVNIAVVGMTALTTGFTGFAADYVSIKIIFGIFGIAGTICGIIGFLYNELREA